MIEDKGNWAAGEQSRAALVVLSCVEKQSLFDLPGAVADYNVVELRIVAELGREHMAFPVGFPRQIIMKKKDKE